MARTIVYPQRRPPSGVYAGGEPVPPPDTYREKLVKLVPAEVVAFFAFAAAQWGDDKTLLIVILVLGTLATPAYLWQSTLSKPREEKPLPHFYGIVTIAFFAWALGVSPRVADLIGIKPSAGAFILTATAFVLPLVDTALAHVLTRRTSRSRT